MNCKCGKPEKARGLCSTCYSAEWRKNNPEKYRSGQDRWYSENKDASIFRAKEWNKNNKEKARESLRKYVKESDYYRQRYNNDIQFRLKVILRNRLTVAIKKNQKAGSAVRDLGCTIDFFKNYLESKFLSGMTWENVGDWEIDHIIPLSRFDLTDREQFLKVCHYTNLQPLWKQDNLSKSSTV